MGPRQRFTGALRLHQNTLIMITHGLRSLSTLALLLSIPLAHAQFPVITQTSEGFRALSSLGSGTKLFRGFNPESGQATILNLDLSVHRVLNFPAAPANMYWSEINYITEELFDTDPATIEFMLVAFDEETSTNGAIFVYRENGTEVFSQMPGSLVGGLSGGTMGFAPIFQDGDQAYMIIRQSTFVGPITYYALPGTLPCMDCHGAPTTDGLVTGGLGSGTISTGLVLYPNPSASEVVLACTACQIGAGTVSIVDAAGRTVAEHSFLGAERQAMNLHGLPAGAYVCLVSADGRTKARLPLQVVR